MGVCPRKQEFLFELKVTVVLGWTSSWSHRLATGPTLGLVPAVDAYDRDIDVSEAVGAFGVIASGARHPSDRTRLAAGPKPGCVAAFDRPLIRVKTYGAGVAAAASAVRSTDPREESGTAGRRESTSLEPRPLQTEVCETISWCMGAIIRQAAP